MNEEKIKRIRFNSKTLKMARQLGIEYDLSGKETDILAKVIEVSIKKEFDEFISNKLQKEGN